MSLKNSNDTSWDRDNVCMYNTILWRVRVTTVAMETQRFVLCVSLSSLCQLYTNTGYCTRLLWRNSDADNNKQQPDLHVKCPIFLADFNEIWISSTDFHRSPRHQISRESIDWELWWYMWTDGQTDRPNEANRRFSQLRRRAYKG